MPTTHRFFTFLAALILATAPALPQDTPPAAREADNPDLPTGFQQLETRRVDGSQAKIFFTRAARGTGTLLPLLVYIEGSGAQSLFDRLDDGRIAMGIFGVIAGRQGATHRVAAVEKRGVFFGDMGVHGSGEGASEEYTRHATLEERAADVRLLITTALADETVDPGRVILLGHSEGADVAALVAARDERVTHVAFLSGGGAAQFYDMFLLTRRQMRADGATEEEIEEGMRQVEEDLRQILADPESETEFYQGHAYKRWATFATRAAADHLARTHARLFLAHGSLDRSVPIESFDYLVSRLLIAGHPDFEVHRYPGRDHSFIPAGAEPGYEGFLEVLDQVLEWADD